MKKTTVEVNDLIKVESSNIDMIGFKDGTTFVQFKKGSVYFYPETTKEEFEALVTAKSVGSHFHKTYRGKEIYHSLDNHELVQAESELSKAMKIVTAAIKNDPSYRIGWQANIAMAFKDVYEEQLRPEGEEFCDDFRDSLHRVANTAADNFLNMLCKDVK